MTELVLTAAESGQRLDAFLAQAAEGMTRSAIQKRMEAGGVLHKGQPVKKNEKTQAGEAYTLLLPDPEPVDIQPENIPLDIVYEDGDVVVVNKPVGMVVHPAPGHYTGTLVNALLYYCGDSLSGINGEIRPGIVHRIDRDTSGLLIVARTTGPTRPWRSS
jgi:23S rRNA pseudouridine1911/1915/1917 synthase